MMWAILGVGALALFIVNFFSGGNTARTIKNLFYGWYYAEDRALAGNETAVTPKEIENCVERNVGIKITVWSSLDDRPMISQRNTVPNTGMVISETDSDDLIKAGVYTLTDIMQAVDGKVPLIVEMKSGRTNEVICRRVADAVLSYGHDNIAVASFHPGMMSWFKEKQKKIFRGIISAPTKDFIGSDMSWFTKFMAGNLMNNFVCRPHFCLYRDKPQSILVKFSFKLGLIQGIWTITDKERAKSLEETKDMIIFKGFVPDTPNYKFIPEREKTQMEIDMDRKEEEKAERRAIKRQYKAERAREKRAAKREREKEK